MVTVKCKKCGGKRNIPDHIRKWQCSLCMTRNIRDLPKEDFVINDNIKKEAVEEVDEELKEDDTEEDTVEEDTFKSLYGE